jgi:hypothetical protein
MYRPNDYIQQIADYIKKNLTKGYTLDALKFSLMNQGYSRISVEKAIETANLQLANKAPLIKEKPQITHKIIDENSEKIVPIYDNPKKGIWKRIFGWFKD